MLRRPRCLRTGPVRTLAPAQNHISRCPERRFTEASAPPQAVFAEESQRFPKKKVALLLAYVGTNFSGLQRYWIAVIVDVVLTWLKVTLEYIQSRMHSRQPYISLAACLLRIWDVCKMHGTTSGFVAHRLQIGWRRSGRTDKGVHSVGNIVVLKVCCSLWAYYWLTFRFIRCSCGLANH
jgi:hypothetical protein